jgi:Adenine specific DNA methylase Mod
VDKVVKNRNEKKFSSRILTQDEITQLLEPKVLTNAKRIDKDGEHPLFPSTGGVPEGRGGFNRDDNGTITDNLIIKGNNLLALHTLKKEFAGKVKLIYIDPPFNTGNDSFQYNDSFNHSTWLTFMRNRLEVAKICLKNDGLLFINIDDIEEAYLKILCDEIFGRENFINVIAVKSSTPSGTKTAHKDKTIIKQKDLILAYKKNGQIKLTPQYTKRDKWDTHYSLYLELQNDEYKLTKLIDKLKENGIVEDNKKLDDIDIDINSSKSSI